MPLESRRASDAIRLGGVNTVFPAPLAQGADRNSRNLEFQSECLAFGLCDTDLRTKAMVRVSTCLANRTPT